MNPNTAPQSAYSETYRQDRPLHELQQRFLDLRFGMFIHFNMATFQDREWGDPTAPSEMFNPTGLDTDQWAQAALSAGMTWGCLTAKHHDGFCLWPTKTDSAGIGETSQKTDIVRAYVDSFRGAGLRTMLYFSMLDLRQDIRHFNVTPQKVELIKNQLTELLTEYGEIDALIIDGWNAPWSRITYQEIPFHEIYGLAKSIQPNCLVCDLNASEFPTSALYYTDLKAFEQNAGQDNPGGKLPAFSCVTMTDGWFWKQADVVGKLKSVEEVVDEWLLPQNKIHCNLILNAPPTPEGRLAPNVIARLAEIGRVWKHAGAADPFPPATVITTDNLATGKPIRASSSPDTIGPDLANDGDFQSSWSPEEDSAESWLEIDLLRPTSFNTLLFCHEGVVGYRFEGWVGDKWEDLAPGVAPEPVQICEIPGTRARRVRLVLSAGLTPPSVAEVGIYDEPGRS